MFELGEALDRSNRGPKFGELLIRRPVAATALLPNSAVLFTAGAVAGALGKITLPQCMASLLTQSSPEDMHSGP